LFEGSLIIINEEREWLIAWLCNYLFVRRKAIAFKTCK